MLTWREGLIAIIGKNGSGKSTLFEAVLLALFGETGAGKEYLRTQHVSNKETVEVRLRLELNGKEYSITREYRGKNLTPYAELECAGRTVCSGHREVTAEIIRLLGMDKDAFRRSIFAGQKELGLLSQLKGSERREFIRELLGVNKIDQVQQLGREEMRNLKAELNALRQLRLSAEERRHKEELQASLAQELGQLETNLVSLNNRLGLLAAHLEESEKEALRQQERLKQHAELRRRLSSLEAEDKQLANQWRLNQSQLAEIESSLPEYTSLKNKEAEYVAKVEELNQLEATKEEYLNSMTLRRNLNELSAKEERLVSELKGILQFLGLEVEADFPLIHEALLKKERALQEDIEKIRHELSQIEARGGALASKNDELKANLRLLQSRGQDAECPTCLRPLSESFADTLLRFNSLIKANEEEGQRITQIKSKLEQRLRHFIETERGLREELQKARIKITMLKEVDREKEHCNLQLKNFKAMAFAEDAYQELKRTVKALAVYHDRFIALGEKISKLDQFKERAKNLGEQRAKISQEISQLVLRLEELGFNENDLDRANRQTQKLKEEYNSVQKDYLAQNQQRIELRHQIHNLAKELKEDHARQQALEQKERRLESLSKLESLFEGFKLAVLSRLQPTLAKQATGLFVELTNGRYEAISIDENFNFLIFDGGTFYPLERFSGGEQDLANLCLRLALSEAIRELAGAQAHGFLAFDEILGSQDQERRGHILAALLKLREKYRQILVISHDEELKDEFPQIVEVRRSGQSSTCVWL